MQDFLKKLGTKAKSTLKDFFTVTPEEEAKGKKPNVVEKTTKKMGDFFAPAPDKVRVRDVVREVPGATANVAKEIAKGVTRFAYSAGESVAGVPLEINELINPGTKYKVPIYEPEKVPGLGFLGPIESYQNQAKREMSKGESGGIKSFLKTAGNIAIDEPVGVAFKPLGLAVGAFIKGGGGKAVQESLEGLVKANAPEEVKALLGSLGIGKKAAGELADPLTKATTMDEVKGILGYTDNVAPKAGKEAVEGVSRETEALYTTDKDTQKKGVKMLEKAFGDKQAAIDHSTDFWAREGEPGVFYHATSEGSPFAFEKGKAANYDVGTRAGVSNVNGLYVGRDKMALDNFYNIAAERGENMIKFEGNPKLLDLTNEDAMIKFTDKYKTGDEIEKAVSEMGYDGVKYFDPYATGEEIVITNTKALRPVEFNGKPIKAPKTAEKAVSRETAPITPGFDKDKFFQGQVSKFKTHDNYMQNKYNGFAKASGLDKTGVDDEAIKWVDDWLYAKPSVPSENVVKQLEAYKPKKPVTLYSGNSIDQLNINRTDPTSFTADLDVAKQFGDAGRRDNPAIIRIENVKPEDIAVSIDDLPKNMLKALGHDTSFAAAEREMVTGKTLADFSKKYNVSISKDGGKTWETLATAKKAPAGKAVTRETDTLYHGTSAPEFDAFNKDGVIYLSKDPAEAKAFADNPIIGGGRGKGTPRTLEVEVPKGKTKSIDEEVQDVVMEGGDLDEVIAKAAEDARKEGYDFLSFNHPSSVDGAKDFEAIVAINPSKLGIKKAGAVSRETPESVDSMRSIGDILKGKGGDIVPPAKPTAKGGKAPKGNPERRFITRTREMAPEVDALLEGKYKPKSNKELIANAEKMIADDYAGAEKIARTGTDDQAVAIANKLIEDELNIARKATDEATKNKAYALAADIANDAAKNLTEAGRAVQAASLLGKMTPEGMARYAARQIQKYNEQAGERTVKNFLGGAKKIPELTGDQLKEITDAMTDINKMADGTDKARALQKLGEKIQSYIPSTLYQKVINVWKAGLLTGLKTTGVNVASNLSHSISEIAKDVPASAVDSIVSLFTGKRTLALTGKGTGKGVAEGVAKGWDYLKTGFDERNIADKLDYKKVNFGKGPVAKALKGYTDTVFGLLGAEDQPFYYAAKMRSLANQASAMAKNEGLSGKAARDFAQKLIENPTDEMARYSTLDAETAVFQQDSWLARKAQNLQKGLEIVLPFAKTPANVANAMINYSPVGIVKTIIENVGKGRFDQRLFSQGMGRGITGTAALAIGSALMANKMMNLQTPSSEKEREQWELEGRIPNSIKIGDKWRNIGVLGPLGMVLIVGGHLREGIDKTGSFAGGLAQSAAGFGSALTEQSFLSGVNRAIDAIKDPNRSFQGFASSLAGSIVPTLIADIARGTDQYERRPDGMIERIQSRIPGARQGLEAKIDAFGQPVETPNFFEVMADATRPGNPTADPKDPVLVELRRLMDAEYGVTPTQLGPTAGYKSLTPEQNSFLWKLAGQATKAEMERVMQSKQYNRYDDEQKSQVLDAAIQDAKTEARARTVIQALKGLSESEQKSKLAEMKEDGLLTRGVFDLYLSLKRKQ